MEAPAERGLDGPSWARRCGRAPWGKINSVVAALADGVHLVQAMYSRDAGISIPTVRAAFTPAVDPILAGRGVVKRAGVLRFATHSMLVTALKCSFHRITLESSHKLASSLAMTGSERSESLRYRMRSHGSATLHGDREKGLSGPAPNTVSPLTSYPVVPYRRRALQRPIWHTFRHWLAATEI